MGLLKRIASIVLTFFLISAVLIMANIQRANCLGMSPLSREYSVPPGGNESWRDIQISNSAPRWIHVVMWAEGSASQFVTLEPTEFDLPPYEGSGGRPYTWVYVHVSVPENTTEGVYSGSYCATEGSLTLCGGLAIRVYNYDLYIFPEDIVLSNSNPVKGEIVEINATVHNQGPRNATSILVQVFNGDPEFDGTLIGEKTIGEIPVGENRSICVDWEAPGSELGKHDVYVVIDPYDTIFEANERNNRAKREITVEGGWRTDLIGLGGYPVVDFAVYNGSLYAAADSKLYVNNGSTWNTIETPTYVTSLEAINVTNRNPPATEWNKTYGGSSDDVGSFAIQTNEGGYAFVGATSSIGAGGSDIWLVKTDSEGKMEWNRTYGGTNDEQYGHLIQTEDGGYVIVGRTNSFGAGDWDAWLFKTDALGNMQWNKTYGGPRSDGGHRIIQTSDGGYAISGTANYYGGCGDFWLIKTDSVGNLEWEKTYGGPRDERGEQLVQSTDGGYAIVGYTYALGDPSSWDFWLVKTDVLGNLEWSKTYGGPDSDWAFGIVETIDGGYAIAGQTHSFGAGGYDFWLVKTDSSGNMQWNKTFGGSWHDFGHGLIQTQDGGYALVGDTSSFGVGDRDFWLVKTDASGNLQWDKTYGGTDFESTFCVIQTNSKEYVIAGYTKSYGAGSGDFWLVKTEPSDATVERLFFGGKGGLYCYDGTSYALIFSVLTYIKVLGIHNDNLYAGTLLDKSPKLYFCNGSADDPADWHIDTSFSAILNFSGPFGSIDSFAEYGGNLYVTFGGTVYCYIETGWSVTKTYDDVYAYLDMQVYDGKLYLATRDQGWRKPLYQGGTGFSGRVIGYDGENWTTIFDHDYWIYSLEVYNGRLFVGTANKIYTYNGTDWEVSFSALDGAYYAISMITYDGKIYAGMGNGYIFVDPVFEAAKTEPPVVPEFPLVIMLPILMLTTSFVTIYAKKKRRKP